MTIKSDNMFSINEITITHIKKLEADELTQLLQNLLRIEAEKASLPDWNVFVPQKITSADGGEDGRIEWSSNKTTDWLKNNLTIFQNKATNLIPSKCFEEILLPKLKDHPRKLKSQIEEVVIKNGCYTLFTRADLNPKEKAERVEEFRRAIREANHPNYATFQILIYDANSIKDWVNENVAAVTFVQACNGISRPNKFRTWDEWESDMFGSSIPFQTNETLLKNISLLKIMLKKEGIVRVIGHSGLGKTRFILESFRENLDNPEISAQQKQLVYYDMGIGSLDNIAGYIISHRSSQSGILVLDNCDENSHHTIAGLVRSSGNFKLITIDFSLETNEKSVIKLERDNQRDIIQKIVEAKFGNTLSKTDKEFIANQSEGYPQMAILFSESVSANGLDKLSSQLPDVFLKKLIFGRRGESEFEYEIIKACSVLSSFGFVDDNISAVLRQEERDKLNRQSDFVRKRICGKIKGHEVEKKDFYRICLKYKTSIIEQRGYRLMVKPTPMAINLAAYWWKETPHEDIKEILSELKDDELGERLVERLSELDQLDKAKEIVNQLWGINSPFGTAEVLNTSLGSLLFRYVVEVNPIATAKTLEFLFGNMSKYEILKIVDGRRNLVWALEKLCFRKEAFNIAAKILFSFAVSENETIGNNSTNQFRQLFQIYLSGTEVTLTERLEIIKWGLEKRDFDYDRIAILALGRGLLIENLSRMGGAEKQGNNAPLVDYIPNSTEIMDYWNEIIIILTQFACLKDTNAELAKEKIANSIRTLIREGHFNLVNNSIQQVVKANGNLWPDGLSYLKRTLAFEEHLPPNIIDAINSLIKELTPKDVKNQLTLFVTKPEWESYEKDLHGHYIDKPKLNAEAFAKKLIDENILWHEHLIDLLEGEQRQGFNFGRRLGELSKNNEELIDLALTKLKKVKRENQNPELLAGILQGASDVKLFEKTIDQIINDEEIQQHSFYIIRTNSPRLKDIEKLFILVDNFNYSIQQFKIFQYGSALEHIENKDVLILCEKISHYQNTGKWTALSIMYMYCFSNNDRWLLNKGFIEKIISESNMLVKSENEIGFDAYHWSDSVCKILKLDINKEFAKTITKQIIEFCNPNNFTYSYDIYIGNVILLIFENFFEATWEYFGQGIIGEYMTFFHLEHMIGARNGYLGGREGFVFRNKNGYDTILKWCRKRPDIAPARIAHMMPLSVREDEVDKWHPFSKMIIDEFGNDEKVLNQLSMNMGTYGSIGSSVPYFITQRKLLEELINHKFQNVREWAERMLDYTNKTIKRERLDDEERYIN